MERDIERCRQEIAAIEAELLAGNPDLQGLLLALSDWSAELRILEVLRCRPLAVGSAKPAQDEAAQVFRTTGETGAI